MVEDPLVPVPPLVVVQRLLAQDPQLSDHGLLHARKPVLDLSSGLEVLAQRDVLSLRADHPIDVDGSLVLGPDRRALMLAPEVKLLDRVKALHHVRLYRLHVARLGQDLEQLVVGEEVEAGERHPLKLQVLLERLLDLIEGLVPLLEVIRKPGLGPSPHTVGVFIGLLHDPLETLVNVEELLRLQWELPLNVGGREDGFQVHPVLLHPEPLVEGILHHPYIGLHLLHLRPDPPHVSARHDRADGNHTLVQKRLDLVNPSQDEHVLGLLEAVEGELSVPPLLLQLPEHRLQHALLRRLRRDLLDLLLVVHHAVGEQEA
mmetsp:Transcript_1967/g.4470  ORF Transcript_1967/g.4470 Transcript_1967/m.4470 type:complete len:317 (-) Transcript_1967:3047-3997(-)